jgi:outer membrane receptor protein involved in Fe transport
MKKILLLLSLNVFIISYLNAQSGLSGKITDEKNQSLFGVNITIKGVENDVSTGTTSDFEGNYTIELAVGTYEINYQYVGYKKQTKRIDINEGEMLNIDIVLVENAEIIEEIVVSASKYEQKLSDVTVSMQVIKPQMIENTNTNNMESAINKIPGVDINDGQPSIRGGSGWSYGAGSRVLVLVDELPIIAADAGNVKWDYLPVENISQVEVIKGASSVLYGSSAMNGVINIRTAYPTEKAKTKIIYNVGFYNQPKNPVKYLNGKTWDTNLYTDNNFYQEGNTPTSVLLRDDLFYWISKPMFGGVNFMHMQQFGNFDFVIAGNQFVDEGYRTNNFDKRTRINTNLRFRSKRVEGLAYGINANFMGQAKSDFLLWASEKLKDVDGNDSVIIRPFVAMDGAVNINEGYRINIDPYAYYYKKNGSRYSIRTRYFFVDNRIPSDTSKNNQSEFYYLEYRYQTDIGEKTKLAAGGVNAYSEIHSNLFGDHFSNNMAGYVQVDNNFGRLKTSVGMRGEYYIVDTTQTESMIDIELGDEIIEIPIKPVFRAGANYRLFEYTNLRASFGQGYRFPSIAEKYTATAFAGLLNVFPNPNLDSETGWNVEVGGHQGFKIGKGWQGFGDIATFYSRYNNMMEFGFGLFDTETFLPLADSIQPTIDNMGFQSQNIGDVRVIGTDISVSARGKLTKNIDLTLFAGYTYMDAINLYKDEAEKLVVYETKNRETDYLKYRYKHSLKGNIIVDYKVIYAGISMIYHSPVLALDNIFVSSDQDFQAFNNLVLPGFTDYYAYHKYRPMLTYDTHFGWNMNESIMISIVIRNLFNREYIERPGNMLPPRSLSFQFKAEF